MRNGVICLARPKERPEPFAKRPPSVQQLIRLKVEPAERALWGDSAHVRDSVLDRAHTHVTVLKEEQLDGVVRGAFEVSFETKQPVPPLGHRIPARSDHHWRPAVPAEQALDRSRFTIDLRAETVAAERLRA